MDVLTNPVVAGTTGLIAGTYVFFAKTGDSLYNMLRSKEELNSVRAIKETFNTTHYGANTATELTKSHAKWSETYNRELKGMGFTNIFKRFGGIHGNQKLEVIVQSVTAIGLVVGFSALLDQLKNSNKKTEADKSLSL